MCDNREFKLKQRQLQRRRPIKINRYALIETFRYAIMPILIGKRIWTKYSTNRSDANSFK